MRYARSVNDRYELANCLLGLGHIHHAGNVESARDLYQPGSQSRSTIRSAWPMVIATQACWTGRRATWKSVCTLGRDLVEAGRQSETRRGDGGTLNFKWGWRRS
ncbi:MAG: hypothetical protein R2856_39890 [Caldilineaceae bacterium]